MNTNVPAGTSGTVDAITPPANTLVVLSTESGKTTYYRSDCPIARDATLSFEAELKAGYKPLVGNRDPNVKDVSILIKSTQTWDVTGDVNGYVYPVQIHTVIRVPNHTDLSVNDVLTMVQLHEKQVNNSDRLAKLLRLKTDVA